MDNKDLDIQNTATDPQKSVDEKVIETINQEEYDNLKNQYLRTLAELINTQKNVLQDKQKAKQSIVLKIINIVETYQIIIQNEDKDGKKDTYDHLRNLLQQLDIILLTEGVKKVELHEGDNYDPKYAEVVSTVDGDDEGKIVQVIMPAYEMYDQIIKTGKVIVCRKK